MIRAVAERDAMVAERDRAVAERDSVMANKERAVAEKVAVLLERDVLRAQLAELPQREASIAAMGES